MTLPCTRLRYLFALEQLHQENAGGARAVEIAAMLGVARPSVHRMMKALKKQGLIEQTGPLLCLTGQGRKTLALYRSDYEVFKAFFRARLALSPLEAEDNAIALLGALCPKCRQALSNFLGNL